MQENIELYYNLQPCQIGRVSYVPNESESSIYFTRLSQLQQLRNKNENISQVPEDQYARHDSGESLEPDGEDSSSNHSLPIEYLPSPIKFDSKRVIRSESNIYDQAEPTDIGRNKRREGKTLEREWRDLGTNRFLRRRWKLIGGLVFVVIIAAIMIVMLVLYIMCASAKNKFHISMTTTEKQS